MTWALRRHRCIIIGRAHIPLWHMNYLKEFVNYLQEVQPLAAEQMYDLGNMTEVSRAQTFTEHREYYIIHRTGLVTHLWKPSFVIEVKQLSTLKDDIIRLYQIVRLQAERGSGLCTHYLMCMSVGVCICVSICVNAPIWLHFQITLHDSIKKLWFNAKKKKNLQILIHKNFTIGFVLVL